MPLHYFSGYVFGYFLYTFVVVQECCNLIVAVVAHAIPGLATSQTPQVLLLLIPVCAFVSCVHKYGAQFLHLNNVGDTRTQVTTLLLNPQLPSPLCCTCRARLFSRNSALLLRSSYQVLIFSRFLFGTRTHFFRQYVASKARL